MPIKLFKKLKTAIRRAEIARNARKGLKDYHAGKLKSYTAEELIEKLNNL